MSLKLPCANEGQLLESVAGDHGDSSIDNTRQVISVRENNDWRWLIFTPGSTIPNSTTVTTPLLQSVMLKSDTAYLALPYMQAMVAVLCFDCVPARPVLLQLGLGAGAINRFLLHHYSDVQLTTVEIEPALLSLYQNYFSPPPQSSETLVFGPAQDYLSAQNSQSDIIFCDLYQQQGMPNCLYQANFIVALSEALTSAGVLVINSTTRNPAQLQPMFNGLRAQFKHLLFGEVAGFENLLIYASQQPVVIDAAKQQRLQQCLALDIANYFQSVYPVSYPDAVGHVMDDTVDDA